MPGPIQPAPLGLLGLLQLKQLGQNPRDLANVVSPIFDLREHYMAAQFKTASVQVSVANNALGFQGMVPVPQGKLWYVYEHTIIIGATTVPTAGNEVRALPAVAANFNTPGQVNLVGANEARYIAPAGGLARAGVACFGRPYLAVAGSSVGSYLTWSEVTGVGAAVVMLVQIEYVDMDV